MVERDTIEQHDIVRSFKCSHPLQESLHPGLPCSIGWLPTRTIELANVGPKHLDTRVHFMHDHGKLNKIIHIIPDQIFLPSSWIDKRVWFIAHRPIFDGMVWDIRIPAYTLVATRVVQKIYPAARYSCPADHVRGQGQATAPTGAFERA